MRPTSGAVFAAANAAMISGVDGASTVHTLLADCLRLLGADTAGVLVRVSDRGLELLGATSHQAVELELYQAMLRNGPCVDSIDSGATVYATGDSELKDRWPDFGPAMVAGGFQTVHASPMRWRGSMLGGMNLFWREVTALSAEEQELAQGFADTCALALMQPTGPDDAAAITDRLKVALAGRVVIERAKGVLAETEGLDMAQAFARLVELSEQRARPLSDVAQDVLIDIVAHRL